MSRVPRVMRWAAWPAGVFLLALIPRLFDLGSRPFWLDEVFTLQRAGLPPAALVQDSFANHHMPSFFLLLSPLAGLQHVQFWLRLPSALFGALAVALVYLIGARIGGRLAGLLAALVLGLSPTALAFSQEARSYTMEMCLILVALYGVLGLAADAPRAALSWRHNASARLHWGLFVGGSVAALAVLGDSLPWVITANLIGAVMMIRAPDGAVRRGLLKNFLAADAVILACCAPLYAVMLAHQKDGVLDSVRWIPPLTLGRLWYSLGSVYMMRIADSVSFTFMQVGTPKVVSWIIGAVLLMAGAAALPALRRRPLILAGLLISVLFLPALFTAVSLWRPVLLPRYILWSAAPFAVLVGVGGAVLMRPLAPRGRWLAAAAAAVLLVGNMVPYYAAETKPRWDLAAQLLAQDVAPGDVVLLKDLGALPVLKVYLTADERATVLADSAGDLKHAEQAELQGKRVWVVFGNAGQTAERKAWPKFYANMKPLGTPAQIQLAGSRIFISLYEPQGRAVTMNCMAPPAAGLAAVPKHNALPVGPNGCG